ncbi:DNA polymerase III subunit gamma and tau [Streptomyces sp. YPW6]|nr:DNA polymerase III subunit gamma and tau [Streptomyces sp. YPW6]
MSSLALYRRYRPESFAEVIGQEHVTDPLQQALRNNRVNHAYLFSGPRGCGKTTSARILARCLNCEQGPTPTPCGECQSCRDLARNGPGSIDVIEIDAASHGGVDDARDLREKAFFGPASSRYKIYIIDEAHMVTPAGFNALLKVVEEPPEHLKFIFATTEPEKVIGTIRSRTHHYPFRLVPPGTLRSYLADVCGRENSPVEDGVLPLVVRAGAGSVRDSMSVMDQLLAGAGDDGVTYAMATALLGYTDGSLLDSIVDAFAAGDGAAAFEVVDRVIEGGNDPRRFVADLLERLRDLVILAAVPDAGDKGLIDAPADVVERMQAQASVFGAAELSRAADLVNDGLTEMRGATSPRLQVELICARVLLPAAYDDERSLQARLDRLERGASAANAAAFAAPPAGAAPLGYVPGPDAHAPQAQARAPQGPAPVAPAGPDAARAVVRGEAPPAAPAAYAPPVAEPAPQALRRPHPSPASGPVPGRPPRAPDPGGVRTRGAGPSSRWLAHRVGPRQRTGPPPHPHPRRSPCRPRRTGRARGRTEHGPGRRPGAEHVARHPGGGQEPPPFHLDPAQPERPGRRIRRDDAPARLPQRGRPRQLREQRQRGGPQAGPRRAFQRPVAHRSGRRRLRWRRHARAVRWRWRTSRSAVPARPGGPRRPGRVRAPAPAHPAAAVRAHAAGAVRPVGPAAASRRAAAGPGLRAGTGGALLLVRGRAAALRLAGGRRPGGRRSGSRRLRALRPRPDRPRARRHGDRRVRQRAVRRPAG